MFNKRNLAVTVGAAALAAWLSPTVVVAQTVQYQFNVPAQDLGDALRAVAVTSNHQIAFAEDQVRGLRSAPVVGEHSLEQAMGILLGNSRFEWSRSPRGVIIVQRAGGARSDLVADEPAVLPEILVQGSGSLNTDVRRTEDDILPYVVFDRYEIQQSQAANIEDFLRSRLPMATDRGTGARNDPSQSLTGNRSSINLRGLGSNQTLILVNGRRAAGVSPGPGGNLEQPDVNGIPIASIERIEVLPGTASGIYGGGATGGVINIILRKDYSGTEVQLTYDNSFDTDSARRRVDVNSGFSLEGGRTQLLVSGSYSDGNDLLAMDRNFIAPARERAFQNAPDYFARNATLNSRRTNFLSAFGTELTLQDGTPFGSWFGSVPAGYLGGDDGAGLLAGAGTVDLTLPEGRTGQRQSLSAVPENQALTLTIRREMTEAIDAYLDLSATRSRSFTRRGFQVPRILLVPGQVGNPFQDYVFAALPDPQLDTDTRTESSTQRVNGGVIIDLPRGWTAGLDVNWNRATNSFRTDNRSLSSSRIGAAIAAGQIDPFRDPDQFPIDYSAYLRGGASTFPTSPTYTKDYSIRVAGPLFTLPAGQVRMTGLFAQRRDEAPGQLNDYGVAFGDVRYAYFHPRSQIADSIYVETVVPLFSAAQNFFLMHALEAQFSGRWDRYRITTSPEVNLPELDSPRPPPQEVTNILESTDYTVGLKYMPFSDLSIRASYATGFLPPSLVQLFGFTNESFNYLEDPRRGYTQSFTDMIEIVGGNPDLKPEESTSQSVGIIYTPSFIRGLRISADFVQIEKTDEIAAFDAEYLLQNEALFPGRVVRGANLPGDEPGWAGVITILDTSLLNAARTRLEATDIQIDYERDIGDLGWFRAYAVGTVQTTMERQLSSSSPMIDRVGFSDGPGRLRFNAGVDWQRGPWTVALNTQFYDEYRVFRSFDSASGQEVLSQMQGSSTVPSQTYTDLSGRYVFENGWLAGTQISVGVRNVFNQEPPLVATVGSFGGYSTFGDPRLRTYSVSIRKSF